MTASVASRLLRWFDRHGRKDLPWQQADAAGRRDAYRVWLSEVMLQQTQVATVIGYFDRFVSALPNLPALAAADEDTVLALWSGLGYYRRARFLHRAAQLCVQQHHGELPRDFDALSALPGIGRSTAGAILAQAHGLRFAILDGNVKRVLTRHHGIHGEPAQCSVEKQLWQHAEAHTPGTRVADYTQAIMDLGATVCMRGKPACGACPIVDDCVAARDQRQAELPGQKPKRVRPSRQATLLIAETLIRGESTVLLERRPAPGIWGGLWSPPQFDSEPAALEWCRRELGEPLAVTAPLEAIDHAFTHFDLRLHPVCVRYAEGAGVNDRDDRLWYALRAPQRVGLPQPIRQLLLRLGADAARFA